MLSYNGSVILLVILLDEVEAVLRYAAVLFMHC